MKRNGIASKIERAEAGKVRETSDLGEVPQTVFLQIQELQTEEFFQSPDTVELVVPQVQALNIPDGGDGIQGRGDKVESQVELAQFRHLLEVLEPFDLIEAGIKHCQVLEQPRSRQ